MFEEHQAMLSIRGQSRLCSMLLGVLETHQDCDVCRRIYERWKNTFDIQQIMQDIRGEVILKFSPEEELTLTDADCIVIFCERFI